MMVSSRPLEPVGLAKLRATTGLKMPDCVVLACAHAHRLGIATFEMALRSVADEGSNAAP
jgi:predicted nucleic acid-binding protein